MRQNDLVFLLAWQTETDRRKTDGGQKHTHKELLLQIQVYLFLSIQEFLTKCKKNEKQPCPFI